MNEKTTGDKATDALIRLTDDARDKYENPANAGVERDARIVRDALANRLAPETARTALLLLGGTGAAGWEKRALMAYLSRVAEQEDATA